MKTPYLPDEIRSTLENGRPALMVTCSADGVPNATIISQVYYVDGTTRRCRSSSSARRSGTCARTRAHSSACPITPAPPTGSLELEFQRSETEGRSSTPWTCRSKRSRRRRACRGSSSCAPPTSTACSRSSSSRTPRDSAPDPMASPPAGRDDRARRDRAEGRGAPRSCSASRPPSTRRSSSTRSTTSRCGRWTSCSSSTMRSSCSSSRTARCCAWSRAAATRTRRLAVACGSAPASSASSPRSARCCTSTTWGSSGRMRRRSAGR